jgi:hypothetical protein
VLDVLGPPCGMLLFRFSPPQYRLLLPVFGLRIVIAKT